LHLRRNVGHQLLVLLLDEARHLDERQNLDELNLDDSLVGDHLVLGVHLGAMVAALVDVVLVDAALVRFPM
jgi:hypothetical protein